ncbi:hypothetical protein B0H13DRAFT_1853093 [Mycena leptocephala]|nr:hypothetical protein B0H13DRAFT_1853093 [Mycena leptocephala]
MPTTMENTIETHPQALRISLNKGIEGESGSSQSNPHTVTQYTWRFNAPSLASLFARARVWALGLECKILGLLFIVLGPIAPRSEASYQRQRYLHQEPASNEIKYPLRPGRNTSDSPVYPSERGLNGRPSLDVDEVCGVSLLPIDAHSRGKLVGDQDESSEGAMEARCGDGVGSGREGVDRTQSCSDVEYGGNFGVEGGLSDEMGDLL